MFGLWARLIVSRSKICFDYLKYSIPDDDVLVC